VVLISFDLDLKIYLKGLKTNKRKKEETTYLLWPAAWRPARAGLPFFSR
jgi:hypothetical protein